MTHVHAERSGGLLHLTCDACRADRHVQDVMPPHQELMNAFLMAHTECVI